MRKPIAISKDLFPLKQPFIIAHTWAIAACCAPLVFPLLFPMAYVVLGIRKASSHLLGVPLQVPPAITFGVTMGLTLAPVFYLAFSKTSRFILENVHCHLEMGELDKALKVALSVDYQVWYREFKKNAWFRDFIKEKGLGGRSARYQKFLDKCGER